MKEIRRQEYGTERDQKVDGMSLVERKITPERIAASQANGKREMDLRSKGGPSLTEEQVARKEAALERQIGEQTRLLLQMKLQRSKWFREEGTGIREQGMSDREKGTGNREQGRTAIATGPNAVAPGVAPSSGASRPESSPKTGQSAETVPGKAPMRAERPADGAAVPLDAEKGQSNLVSAA